MVVQGRAWAVQGHDGGRSWHQPHKQDPITPKPTPDYPQFYAIKKAGLGLRKNQWGSDSLWEGK